MLLTINSEGPVHITYLNIYPVITVLRVPISKAQAVYGSMVCHRNFEEISKNEFSSSREIIIPTNSADESL